MHVLDKVFAFRIHKNFYNIVRQIAWFYIYIYSKDYTSQKTVAISSKVTISPEIPLLDMYPRDMEILVYTSTQKADFFIISPNWNKIKISINI